MRRLLLAVLLPLLPACAASPAASPATTGPAAARALAPPAAEALRVQRIPNFAGDFRLQGMYRFGRPELGVGFRYSDGEPVRLDVYVYPVPPEVAASDDPVAAAAEVGRTELREGLDGEVRKGNLQSFELLTDSTITVSLPHGQLPGTYIFLRFISGGSTMDSHQHHFMVGDQLVKVRTSYPADAMEAATVDAFIRDFLDRLTSPAPPPRSDARVR